MMQTILAVAAGGALGATGRFLLSGAMMRAMGGTFPLGTLSANVLGALLMGLLVALFADKWSVPGHWQSFFTTGLLGGFTTFSAFSLECVLMLQRGEYGAAALYIAASVLLCIAALIAGMSLVRLVA